MMSQPTRPNAQSCLLMRLDIDLADGGTQTIVTDPSWQATTDGPIRRAGIYFGETYDATKEMSGWDRPGFAAAGWMPVQVLPFPDGAEQAILVAQRNEPIRVEKELQPVKLTEPKPGVYVFDMGQNMVGWCRLKATAPAGTKITVRHAEVLLDDGMICTANLLDAAQINEYTWPGGEASLEPHFTYHGFRYVEVSGLPSRPAEDAVVGRVFHSDAAETGRLACSNELINKILRCAQWTQRGNMLERAHRLPAAQRTRGLDGRHPGILADGHLPTRHGRLFHQVADRYPRLEVRRRPLFRRVAACLPDPELGLFRRACLGRCRRHHSMAHVPELCRYENARRTF